MKQHVWGIWLLLCALATTGFAQEKQPLAKVPLVLTFSRQAIALPPTVPLSKAHCGASLATEWRYADKPAHQTFQTLELGFYQQRPVQTGIYVQSALGYRRFLVKGLYAEGLFGLGYLHLRMHLRSYQPDGNGGFAPAPQQHYHRVLTSATIGLGYALDKHHSVFVRYQLLGETPYQKGGLPILTHTALQLGFKF